MHRQVLDGGRVLERNVKEFKASLGERSADICLTRFAEEQLFQSRFDRDFPAACNAEKFSLCGVAKQALARALSALSP